MNLKSEIDNNLVVRIWDLDNPFEDGSPFAIQDIDPRDGQPFSSRADAQEWLDKTINDLTNPPAPPK